MAVRVLAQRLSVGLDMLALQEEGVYPDQLQFTQADFDLISHQGWDELYHEAEPVSVAPYVRVRRIQRKTR